MFYHESAQLGMEVSNRLDHLERRMTIQDNKLGNNGSMSYNDCLMHVLPLTEKRVMDYINLLIGKENVVAIPLICKTLNIPEEILVEILQKNGIELFCESDEDEGDLI